MQEPEAFSILSGLERTKSQKTDPAFDLPENEPTEKFHKILEKHGLDHTFARDILDQFCEGATAKDDTGTSKVLDEGQPSAHHGEEEVSISFRDNAKTPQSDRTPDPLPQTMELPNPTKGLVKPQANLLKSSDRLTPSEVDSLKKDRLRAHNIATKRWGKAKGLLEVSPSA